MKNRKSVKKKLDRMISGIRVKKEFKRGFLGSIG